MPPTPTSACTAARDVFGNETSADAARGDEVRLEEGGPHVQLEWCFPRKIRDAGNTEGGKTCEDRGRDEDGVTQLRAKECQKLPETTRSQEGNRTEQCPQGLPEGTSCADTLTLDLWPPELGSSIPVALGHPVCSHGQGSGGRGDRRAGGWGLTSPGRSPSPAHSTRS